MKLIIKDKEMDQKEWFVYDEANQPVYTVRWVEEDLLLFDRDGNEIGKAIREEAQLPKYQLSCQENKGVIEKCFSISYPKYELSFGQYRIEGNCGNWNFSVYEACSVAAGLKPSEEGIQLQAVTKEAAELAILVLATIDKGNKSH